MASPGNSQAPAAAVGYLFQCRYALLRAIQAIPSNSNLEISIEKFDDVAFEIEGTPVELIQAKHHVAKLGNLTNASVDLWRTLGIWSHLAAKDPTTPLYLQFVLMTTGAVSEGSAASYLRMRDRSEEKADQILFETASTSQNKDNAACYDIYKSLSPDLRLNLLKAIYILDSSPNIIDVQEEIVRELYHAAPKDLLPLLVERLEGWWFGVVITALNAKQTSAISVLSLESKLDELREQFKKAALPVDYASVSPTAEIVAELDKRPFVRQLRKIQVSGARVEYAIRDFYRASEQRSRWAREQLLFGDEISDFERQLIEAWQPRFAAMVDKLPTPCDEVAKKVAGQSLFEWAEVGPDFSLRNIRERFLSHGSLQILANRYAVGWHPDYKEDDPANVKEQ
jgi:hypothetical protein